MDIQKAISQYVRNCEDEGLNEFFETLTEHEKEVFIEQLVYFTKQMTNDGETFSQYQVLPDDVKKAFERKQTIHEIMNMQVADGGSDSYNMASDIIQATLKTIIFDQNFTDVDITKFKEMMISGLDETLADLMCDNILYEDNEFVSPAPFKLNLLLGLPAEKASHYTAISEFIGDFHFNKIDASKYENALTWLIQQQGYKPEDLTSASSDFMVSILDEVINNPIGSSEAVYLTVCCELSLEYLLENPYMFIQGEVVIPETATIGLFAPFAGTCSTMNIALEKPLVLPVEMIARLQVNGANHHKQYTVQDVISLAPEAWNSPVTRHQPQPEPTQEM